MVRRRVPADALITYVEAPNDVSPVERTTFTSSPGVAASVTAAEDETLQSRATVLRAGLKITSEDGRYCTIGAIVKGTHDLTGRTLLLTAAHCTRARFSMQLLTRFYQPDPSDPWYYVGLERWDPPASSQSGYVYADERNWCTTYRTIPCRFSDVAAVEIAAGQAEVGGFARPYPRTITIMSQDKIAGTVDEPTAGMMVEMIGAVSGHTSGWMHSLTCVDRYVDSYEGGRVNLRCEQYATYASQDGDSGAPVFASISPGYFMGFHARRSNVLGANVAVFTDIFGVARDKSDSRENIGWVYN